MISRLAWPATIAAGVILVRGKHPRWALGIGVVVWGIGLLGLTDGSRKLELPWVGDFKLFFHAWTVWAVLVVSGLLTMVAAVLGAAHQRRPGNEIRVT
ncbi:MAG TPA: hypothetical protein VFT27_04790 [Actinomycetota bacterium]|nr:hypothetical protein [Actinomycetota bacterium]